MSLHKATEVFSKEGDVLHHDTRNMNRKTFFELFVVLGCWEKTIQAFFASGVHIRQLPKVNSVLHTVHLNVMQRLGLCIYPHVSGLHILVNVVNDNLVSKSGFSICTLCSITSTVWLFQLLRRRKLVSITVRSSK